MLMLNAIEDLAQEFQIDLNTSHVNVQRIDAKRNRKA